VLAWAVAYLAGVSLAPQLGRAQDDLLEPPPADSLVLPSYSTSYDRDHTREAWGQDLYYGLDRKRTSFNVTGSTDTQRFLRLPNKSTHGSINGQLNYGLIGTWQLVLRGWYDMNSSVNGPSFDDSRNNRINIQTQYLLLRPGGLQGNFYAYTEFERKQDLNRNSSIAHDPSDSTVVDSLVASRDSSYTTSRNDAVSAEITWPARRWLELRETAMVFRSQPVITSLQRSFINPLDGTQGGRSTEERQRSNNPTGNRRFTTAATYTHGMTKAVVSGATSNLSLSYFDKQRLSQENSKLENTFGNFTLDHPLIRGVFLHGEGSITRNLSEYKLNASQTRLVHDQRGLAQATYIDSSFYGNVNFTVERTRTERHQSLNGVEVDRAMGGLFRWRRSKKLVLDGNGSVSLRISDYKNDRIDQDALNSFFSLGGGYMLAPACSTTIHFSRGQSHTVSLDPNLSGGNIVKTSYQMNATIVYLPTRNFALRQNYLINAEYRIFDYAEMQNSVTRARRVDTDVADTLFSFGIIRLTHNFVFQDQGTYARFDGVNRRYSIASRSFGQTLTASAGAKIAPGVLFLATQSLINKRDRDLVRRRGTLQNTWKVDLSLQVFRTLRNGFQIDGALRRQGQYVEGRVASSATTEDDWVAGVSVRKAF
jgi:hypothetical protein